MAPNAWVDEITQFSSGVETLFEGRPFWLVTEADVRSKFIEAVVKKRKNLRVHDVCTEASIGNVSKIDLVVKDSKRGTLAVEFKRWQIVVKPNSDFDGPRRSTSSNTAMREQWKEICDDVRKLKPLLDRVVCVIVVYWQHRLTEEHSATYAGRRPLGDSHEGNVQSGKNFQKALESAGIKVAVEDWLPKSNTRSFTCRASTDFTLGVFRIRKR